MPVNALPWYECRFWFFFTFIHLHSWYLKPMPIHSLPWYHPCMCVGFDHFHINTSAELTSKMWCQCIHYPCMSVVFWRFSASSNAAFLISVLRRCSEGTLGGIFESTKCAAREGWRVGWRWWCCCSDGALGDDVLGGLAELALWDERAVIFVYICMYVCMYVCVCVNCWDDVLGRRVYVHVCIDVCVKGLACQAHFERRENCVCLCMYVCVCESLRWCAW
jgi:hypothetical protein